MNRRELLKAAAVFSANGMPVGKIFKLEPSAKYVVFVDSKMINADDFSKRITALPPGTVVLPIAVPIGKTIDDAVRIYTQD